MEIRVWSSKMRLGIGSLADPEESGQNKSDSWEIFLFNNEREMRIQRRKQRRSTEKQEK